MSEVKTDNISGKEEFDKHCAKMNKSCNGKLDSYILGWKSGGISGTAAFGKTTDISEIIAMIVDQMVPEDYQLKVIDDAKDFLVNKRISRNFMINMGMWEEDKENGR